MKYFTCMMALLLTQTAFASDDNTLWTGVLWRDGETPIVAPIQFKSEAECKRLLNQMNDISRNTVHVERHTLCSQILPQVRH